MPKNLPQNKEYMLWSSPSKNKRTKIPFLVRVTEAINYFKNKHGYLPRSVIVREDEADRQIHEVQGVTIDIRKGLAPNHFLLGEIQ